MAPDEPAQPRRRAKPAGPLPPPGTPAPADGARPVGPNPSRPAGEPARPPRGADPAPRPAGAAGRPGGARAGGPAARDGATAPPPPRQDEPTPYTKYRAGPSLLRRREREPTQPRPGRPRRFGRPSVRRVLTSLVLAVMGWILLSVVVFLVSAAVHRQSVDGGTSSAFPLTSATTILVLGSDARPKGSKEPGAATNGSRADSILLMRVGAGHASRLSIPRDTVVQVPGHGEQKINAAFAFGGAKLMIQTIEQGFGVDIDHVVEVDFANFPDLIDAMGGVDYEGGCVVSRINGGYAQGGYTLRLRNGKSHIDGKQALALARTRKNDCNKKENDLTRARRQQKLFSSMKSRLLSPGAFIRLPFISWAAPKSLKSDMGGPTLLGLFGALATSGTPPTRVLKGTPSRRADLGDVVIVPEAGRRAAIRRFEKE